jgi:CBS domain-containing protein
MKTKLNPLKMQVKDVLSKEVVTVNATDTIRDALTLMVENRVAALPVVTSRGKCAGMISATDLIALTRDLNDELAVLETGELNHQWLLDQLAEHDFGRRRVEELMTEVVETAGPDATLAQAGRIMLRRQVHRLPVVDAQGNLLGIVSTTDLLAALLDGEE